MISQRSKWITYLIVSGNNKMSAVINKDWQFNRWYLALIGIELDEQDDGKAVFLLCLAEMLLMCW